MSTLVASKRRDFHRRRIAAKGRKGKKLIKLCAPKDVTRWNGEGPGEVVQLLRAINNGIRQLVELLSLEFTRESKRRVMDMEQTPTVIKKYIHRDRGRGCG